MSMFENHRPLMDGASGSMASKVELSLECRDLIDSDVFSKSDPFVVMYVRHVGKSEWREFDRTEIIWNNLNPDFVHKFVIDYFFEERQHIRFCVYDSDDPNSADLAKHDFLGESECTLGEIVSNGRLSRPLKSGQGRKIAHGSITITAEEQSTSKEELTVPFAGKGLDKKDFFGKSDPYLSFYKVNEDQTYTVVHRTEVIKNTLNPQWQPVKVPVRNLCAGDYDRLILVRCYDWNRDGTEDLIGEFWFTIRELLGGEINKWELINSDLQRKKKKYKNSGLIYLTNQPKLVQVPTFLDYVMAGTQLACTIAIDFTASNGNPTQPASLHYVHSREPNQYERALRAVGEVIQDYDSDHVFPVLGFGARLPPNGEVSHNFHVNGNPSNANCAGLDGVMAAYSSCLRSVQLYGPTNFSPIINRVAHEAAQHRDASEYQILLIITDGVITDMPQTKDAIVAASGLPLSIIIIGVGGAEFDAMEELDGDQVRVTDRRGRPAQRDIVQFVPFRDFIGQQNNVAQIPLQARLAKEVLAEIPDQFLSYMQVNRIKPADVHRRHTMTGGLPTAVPGARPPQPQGLRRTSQTRPLVENTQHPNTNGVYPEPPPAYPGL